MRIAKQVAILALIALFAVPLTSCGGSGSRDESSEDNDPSYSSGYSNSKAKEMIQKDDDGKLDTDDYATMIKWIQDYYEDYMNEWESVIEDNKEYKDYKFAKAEMDADFGKEYIFISRIEGIVAGAAVDEKKVGKENKDKYDSFVTKKNDRVEALRKKVPTEK